MDKSLPLTDIATLDEPVQASISGQRVRTWLLSLVAGAALFLAATEISIRMALGAPAPRLFGMILRDGMRPVIIGATAGLGGAYAASYLIRSLLFGTVPADAPTYLLTVLILQGFRCAPLRCLR